MADIDCGGCDCGGCDCGGCDCGGCDCGDCDCSDCDCGSCDCCSGCDCFSGNGESGGISDSCSTCINMCAWSCTNDVTGDALEVSDRRGKRRRKAESAPVLAQHQQMLQQQQLQQAQPQHISTISQGGEGVRLETPPPAYSEVVTLQPGQDYNTAVTFQPLPGQDYYNTAVTSQPQPGKDYNNTAVTSQPQLGQDYNSSVTSQPQLGQDYNSSVTSQPQAPLYYSRV